MSFLQTSTRNNRYDTKAASHAICETLEFRKKHALNRDDVLTPLEMETCRSYWPFGFADAVARDGCPIQFCRVSRLSIPRILRDFEEDQLMHFFALWCEHTLRLQAASIRAGYDVYDCTGVSWAQLLLDAKEQRAVIGRVFSVGGNHFPGSMHKCYIINAPYAASLLWRLIAPLIKEAVRCKVTISSGVPSELVDAIGGDAAFRQMVECSPHVMAHAQLQREAP